LIGPNIQFEWDSGKKVNVTHQSTPFEGQVQHETVLEPHAVRGKKTFEMDRKPGVLTVFLCGFRRPPRFFHVRGVGHDVPSRVFAETRSVASMISIAKC
jgi:hypothetical protein